MPSKNNARVLEDQDEPVLKRQKLQAEPCHTLYVKNLNDKLNKNFLKEQLYLLFSTYGEVIDIILLKTQKMRGQAHVVFTSVNDASVAMRSLQDDVIFDKNLVIQWAKSDGNIIEKLST